MDRNIKRILAVSIILLLIVLAVTTVNAVTIKETTDTSDKYDTIEKGSYIIGTTKFTPETVITGSMAAQAGANDMKLYIAQNGTAEEYEYPKVYYYNTFGKWKEYTSEGELKDAKLSSTDFTIYYVDNKAKTGEDSVTKEKIELPTIEKKELAYSFINDTTAVKVGTVKEEETVTVPAAPTKDHYTFNGWYYTDSEGNLGDKVEPNAEITITEDTVIVATWEINKYTVSFATEDGETILYSHEFEYGTDLEYKLMTDQEIWEEMMEIDIPEKEGTEDYVYNFNGWDKEIGIVEEDTTYKVVYEKAYHIKFVNDDGTHLSSIYLPLGKIPDYYDTPTKPDADGKHFEFANWDKEFTAVTGPTTYTAIYTEEEFVNSKESFNSALADENVDTIVLDDNIELDEALNIPEGKEVTIDLNGNNLKATSEYALNIHGNVTINDSTNSGKITGTQISVGKNGVLTLNAGTIENNTLASDNTGYGVCVFNGGKFVINGGSISSIDSPISGNNTLGMGNIEINGGTLTATQGPAIYMPMAGTLTITDGTLNGGISVRVGTINISGGTINATTGDIDSITQYYSYSGNAWLADAIYLWNGTYQVNGETADLTVNITGGTFSCTNGQGSAFALYDIGKVAENTTITISKDATFTTTTEGRETIKVLNQTDMGISSPKAGYFNPEFIGKYTLDIEE